MRINKALKQNMQTKQLHDNLNKQTNKQTNIDLFHAYVDVCHNYILQCGNYSKSSKIHPLTEKLPVICEVRSCLYIVPRREMYQPTIFSI